MIRQEIVSNTSASWCIGENSTGSSVLTACAMVGWISASLHEVKGGKKMNVDI